MAEQASLSASRGAGKPAVLGTRGVLVEGIPIAPRGASCRVGSFACFHAEASHSAKPVRVSLPCSSTVDLPSALAAPFTKLPSLAGATTASGGSDRLPPGEPHGPSDGDDRKMLPTDSCLPHFCFQRRAPTRREASGSTRSPAARRRSSGSRHWSTEVPRGPAPFARANSSGSRSKEPRPRREARPLARA